MQVIAISGSPRKQGNTATLLQEAVDACHKAGIKAEVLFLTDYEIKHCDGCLFCEGTGCSGECTIKDDMTKIVAPRLLAADGLIIGTPSYFDLPTGLLKVFMDRSNAILAELTEKKLPYGLVVVGQSNMESLSFATQALERFCGICGMECVPDGHVKAIARDVADVQRNESNMKAARRLGLSLSRKVLRRINPTEDTR